MTSDKPRLRARDLLDYALGKKRVKLSELTAAEFDEFLRSVLSQVDLRELRGFGQLKDMLSRSPGSFVYGERHDPLDYVNVTEETVFKASGVKSYQFNLMTHVVSAHRGAIHQQATYVRLESGERTTDRKVLETWGHDWYVQSIEKSLLVLRRPSDHTGAEENLFLVKYLYEKVPHKDEMAVKTVAVERISIESFRTHFGKNYPTVGMYLVWEIRDLSSRTLSDLLAKADSFRQSLEKLERLSGSITDF